MCCKLLVHVLPVSKLPSILRNRVQQTDELLSHVRLLLLPG
jgi:hypothetical protein